MIINAKKTTTPYVLALRVTHMSMSSAPPTYAVATANYANANASASNNNASNYNDSNNNNNDANNTNKNNDPDLAAFWDIFKLGPRRELLNAYFGLESVEDLEDVLLGDLKTIAFADWAARNLTIVDKNRLRRAVNHYQLQIKTAPDLYATPVGVDSVACPTLQSVI